MAQTGSRRPGSRRHDRGASWSSADSTSLPRERAVVAVATGCAALLAGWRLGAPSLWVDEAASHAIAVNSSLTDLLTNPDPSAPLYYVLLWAWVPLGRSEAMLRWPSLVFAIATLPVFWSLARRLAGSRAAMIGVVLLALNGMLLTWAREARGYTLVLFLTTSAAYGLVRAVDDEEGRHWWGVATAAAVLAAYAHPLSVVVVGPLFVVALSQARPGDRRPAALSAVVAGLFVLPIAAIVAEGTGLITHIDPLRPGSVARLGREFAGVSANWMTAPAALLFVVGVLATWRDIRHGATLRMRRTGIFLLVWMVVPVVTLALMSLVRPVFVPRYLIATLPAFVLILAAGLARTRRNGLVAAGVSLLVLAGLPEIASLQREAGREDWRAAMEIIEEEWRDGDVMLVEDSHSFYVTALGYYATAGLDGTRDEGYRYPVGTIERLNGDLDVLVDRSATEPIRGWYVARSELVAFEPLRELSGEFETDAPVAPTVEAFPDWAVAGVWLVERLAVAVLVFPDDGEDAPS